ncbi:uncharacterized protein [Haliotis asinina]|uniref:uncharacterized protein isoform X2 n=1 Tax=Haliotis asinina TaxID=109174 RepID=UPI003531DBC8
MAAKEIIPGCAVCQRPHVYGTEGPFLLPCLHSVCENCLKSEIDETFLCSSCQETFPKASFPTDAVTRKKTLLFTIAHDSNELSCTNREDGNRAMSWCQECEAFLCEHCHFAHGDMKATRKHKVIVLQDLTNCPQTLKCMSYCDQHAQHPVTFYDSSCNVPLCAMCVLSEHTSCKTENLNSAWETRQSFLEEKGVALRAKLGRLQECRALQEDICQRLKPQQEAVEDVIRCTFQKLHLMLDQREIELKAEIEESTKFLIHRSDHQLVTLDSDVNKLTMNLEFIQTSTLFPNPVEHFAMKDVIDKQIRVASESEIPRINSQEYAMTLSTDGLHGLHQQISSLGALLNSHMRSDTSDVQYLYIEEATEEQKARARKYLLPESFYLYENKPPCPGCIGCEDYDPSKVSVSSKVKAKCIAGSVGASEGFSMFGQASGISFSTLAAQGDAVGVAFKKDIKMPLWWSVDIDCKPIIELPQLVEIKTGEEGWEVVYCQRSKLFRFVRESNQWKERGVGDMKILKQGDDKYRMLMRRDQVHKVACNHLIAPDMVLSPMATSERAWCWTAQDYAENQAKVELFALRFKTEEQAKQFKKKFEEALELVRQIKAAAPAKNANNSAAEPKRHYVSVTEEEEEEEEEDDDDDDDDDEEEEEEEEEENIVFEKRVALTYFENDEWENLGMGSLKILYNEDLNGGHIDMDTDDRVKICNHIICREHSITLEKPKRACMWSALDFSTNEPVRRNFKAYFCSVATAEEFAEYFLACVRLARDSELCEHISPETDTPVIYETRMQPGFSECSESAVSSQTGEGQKG